MKDLSPFIVCIVSLWTALLTPSDQAIAQPASTVSTKIQTSEYPAVTGIVKDIEGNPIANACVLLATDNSSHVGFARVGELNVERYSRARLYEGCTDSFGRYAITGMPHVGNVLLTFRARGFADTCRKSVLQSASTTAISDTILVRGKVVRGAIVDPKRQPVNDALVVARDAWTAEGVRSFHGVTTTNQHGLFEINVHPQANWLTLQVISDRLGQSFFIDQPVSEDLALTMAAHAAIHGKVSVNDGSSPQRLVFYIAGELPETPSDAVRSGIREADLHYAALSETGEFRVDGLSAGLKYRMNVLQRDAKDNRRSRRLMPNAVAADFSAGEIREITVVIDSADLAKPFE